MQANNMSTAVVAFKIRAQIAAFVLQNKMKEITGVWAGPQKKRRLHEGQKCAACTPSSAYCATN
jgi:hypothetical protein